MRKSILLAFITISFARCAKFVDPGQPPTQLNSVTLFSNDATATAAMFDVYAQMEATANFANLVVFTGLSSDEFALNGTNTLYAEFKTNNILPGNAFADGFWSRHFVGVYRCNLILEGLEKSTTLSTGVRTQLEGEALFTRAYCLFNLLNLFGEIPLPLSTNFEINARLPRSSIPEVFMQIEGDLEKAKTLLAVEYKNALNNNTTERTRPNKAAAMALLSKVYLYDKNWVKAIAEASGVISQSGTYQLQADLATAFQKNKGEHIWQIQNVLNGLNTYTGYLMILRGRPTNVYLDKRILDVFEPTDKRRINWISFLKVGVDTFYYAHKYKVGLDAPTITEYTSLLRLAEVYLIRAEALGMTDKLPEAETDLNVIRNRAGIQPISGLTKTQFLDSLYLERRRELFAENCSRWFDLKRSGRANAVLSPLKAPNWAPTDALYPLPASELIRNSQLTQNPGY